MTARRAAKAFVGPTVVVHVALAAWVRRDADGRGVDPAPWDRLTLLTGLFGVVGYLLSRRAAA
ncbi:hypothetical protein C474_03665 [Halogeometricum pallidum JCM 14848]|uniref:Uncharacterized protein n=1 Tax=Halogeometricum pallidum JCM 14848 TaxID=1227487 RepID=M0DIP5_HALPD|nr:hypothetical protein [Halogeometricum pallidum]ELZ34024.1 hypothetical protein C474_03665 [Halogeometricum pallidum JCM 14848]